MKVRYLGPDASYTLSFEGIVFNSGEVVDVPDELGKGLLLLNPRGLSLKDRPEQYNAQLFELVKGGDL